MTAIDTPLLIVGHGPAALVTAKLVSGAGLACLVAGHKSADHQQPVELDERSRSILEPHGVLDVLRPYAASQQPFAIVPTLFEDGLKHHCVADMLVTVYDDMTLVGPMALVGPTDQSAPAGSALVGALTDGKRTWPVSADSFLDATTLGRELNDAVHAAADFANELIEELRRQAAR